MATISSERPRSLNVPAPYGSTSSSKTPDTIKALRDKLSDFHSENTLLGNLVKDLKAERDGLSKRLTVTTKQLAETSSKAASASQQAEASTKEQRRLQAEVDRLSAVVHSHSVRLQKSKQQQKELEDVALDLRQELDDAKAKLEAAEQASQQAQQRSVAAEAKLVAAGLGSLPKMGPTVEQLVINSTQRIKELTEELAAAKADAAQQSTASQLQLQQQQQQWQQQLAAAEQKVQQQECTLQQQSGRLQEAEQQCRQLQELLVGMQHKVAEGQTLAEAQAELQRLKQDMLSQSQALQQQVVQLQGRLADAELQHASAMSEQQQQLTSTQRQLAAAQRERQELTATLVAVRQQESSHRLSVGEVTAKVERLRGELVKCVGELQVQLEAATAAGQQHSAALQQLRAAEATAAAARQEAGEMRQQLVELASATVAELRAQVAGEAVAITGLPDDIKGDDLPLPVSSYIKVLEHAVCDCEQRCKQLLADNLAAQQQEQQLRQALAAAREQQAAAERALQQQTQRLLAVERMRLSDMREAQGLEKRLLLAQQECWNLRDALLAHKAGDAAAAAVGSSGIGAAAGSALTLSSLAGTDSGTAGISRAMNRPIASATRADAAAVGAEMHCNSAAGGVAAAGSQYQSKLAQLRQLKGQLNSRAAKAGELMKQASSDAAGTAAAGDGSSGCLNAGPAGLMAKGQQRSMCRQNSSSSNSGNAGRLSARNAAAGAAGGQHVGMGQGTVQNNSFRSHSNSLSSSSRPKEQDGSVRSMDAVQYAGNLARGCSSATAPTAEAAGDNSRVMLNLKQESNRWVGAGSTGPTAAAAAAAAAVGCSSTGVQGDLLSPKELAFEDSSQSNTVGCGGVAAAPCQQQQQQQVAWLPQVDSAAELLPVDYEPWDAGLWRL